MKLASLMAGVAALALVAAPAMADTINQGSAIGGFNKGLYGAYAPDGTTDMNFIGFVKTNGLGGQDSGISVFTATGSSAANNGTASNN
jgi:hypothetical protein